MTAAMPFPGEVFSPVRNRIGTGRRFAQRSQRALCRGSAWEGSAGGKKGRKKAVSAAGAGAGAGLAVNPSPRWGGSTGPRSFVAGGRAGGGSSQGTGEVLPLIQGASRGLQLHWGVKKKKFASLKGL